MRLKRIGLSQAEGFNNDPRLGKTFWFPSVRKAQQHLHGSKMPELGYDKHDVFLEWKGGEKARLRYDHGLKDPSLREQLKYTNALYRRK